MTSSASTPPPDSPSNEADVPAAAVEPAAAAPAATEKPARRSWRESELWTVLRETYGTFDRRTLGFTRLMLGFYLIMDLFRRTDAWDDMFSNKGVLPNDVNLWRPQASYAWSLVNAFSTHGELVVLWWFILVTYVCLFVGYRTKIAQILTVFIVTSMNGRVLFIENGGYVVQNLLVLWTAFLPLGDRFSVDSLRRSLGRTREATEDDLNDSDNLADDERPNRYVTLLGLVLLTQLAAVYYFNVVHKTGPAWRNGTAVHYVLYVDRMVTPLVASIRDYAPNWLILFLTKTTLAFEATIPVCLLSPLGVKWARRVALSMINALHIGFGTTFVLGPFAWAACVFSTLLFSTEDWELAIRTMRRERRARFVIYDPASSLAFQACRLVKRLDNFDLLTFRAERGAPGGLAVLRPDGSRVTGALALSDIVAALPVGPVFAWMLRVPGLKQAADALSAAIFGPRGDRFFGLDRRKSRAPLLAPSPSAVARVGQRGVVLLRELMILAMFAGAVNQALVELWVVNRRIKVGQPEPLRMFAQKLRFLQGWFMFSPNPVMDDGTIIVDALTVDGRHVDPFWRKEPNFDLLSAKSFSYDQIWSDYFNRMHLPANSAYRDAMKEYMLRLPERTGRPEDAIVSGDVYWVQDMNPKWNEKSSYKQENKKLFSFVNSAIPRPAAAPVEGGAARAATPGDRRARAAGADAAPSGDAPEVELPPQAEAPNPGAVDSPLDDAK